MSLPDRILIVGISGIGKSTISRKIAKSTGAPLYHMDSIHWLENWTKTSPDEIERKLEQISRTDRWIVEGWIDNYSKNIVEGADLVLYLDFPGWVAFVGGICRWIRYFGRKRPELPKGCTEFLDPKYIRTMLFRKERPHIEKMLAAFSPKNLIRTGSRSETRALINQLVRNEPSPTHLPVPP